MLNHTTITGPNSRPMDAVPRLWIGEQPDEDRHRDRHDESVERLRRHLGALHRGQHGDRRRDHAVAVEEGRAEQPDQDQDPTAPIGQGPDTA